MICETVSPTTCSSGCFCIVLGRGFTSVVCCAKRIFMYVVLLVNKSEVEMQKQFYYRLITNHHDSIGSVHLASGMIILSGHCMPLHVIRTGTDEI